MPRKKQLYAELLERQKQALEAGYHYESCWYAHAILEDRSRSIIANSGDGCGYGGNISEKLALILNRLDAKVAKVVNGRAIKDKKTGKKEKVPRWPHLHTIERRLVKDVLAWTKDRNDLVHKLASGENTLADADVLIEKLANQGSDLTQELCAAARRVKKRPPSSG